MSALWVTLLCILAPLVYIGVAAYVAGAAIAWKKAHCDTCLRPTTIWNHSRFYHAEYVMLGVVWPAVLVAALPASLIIAAAVKPFKLGETVNERREKRAVS